jgi:hypothetical protein
MAHSAQPTGKEKWALTSTGFRQIRPGLWLSSDNLRRTCILLVDWLNELGSSTNALLANA